MMSATTTKPQQHQTSTRFTDDDLSRFNEGTHDDLSSKLGAHVVTASDGTTGTHFVVWAPNARGMHVVGSFNDWSKQVNALTARGRSGKAHCNSHNGIHP